MVVSHQLPVPVTDSQTLSTPVVHLPTLLETVKTIAPLLLWTLWIPHRWAIFVQFLLLSLTRSSIFFKWHQQQFTTRKIRNIRNRNYSQPATAAMFSMNMSQHARAHGKNISRGRAPHLTGSYQFSILLYSKFPDSWFGNPAVNISGNSSFPHLSTFESKLFPI